MTSNNDASCTLDTLKTVLNETTSAPLNLPENIRILLLASQTRQLDSSEIAEISRFQKQRKDVVNADEIITGIYVGDSNTAQNLKFLKEKKIGFVINCAQGVGYDQLSTIEEFYEKNGIKYLGLNISDQVQSNLMQYLDEFITFIDGAINSSCNVLIHCIMGRSRSATVAAAYLMTRKKLSAEEAVRTIHQRRFIHPNEGFLMQLINLEITLKHKQKV